MFMDMEGKEDRHKEEKGPRAASALHSWRGAEQKRREKSEQKDFGHEPKINK